MAPSIKLLSRLGFFLVGVPRAHLQVIVDKVDSVFGKNSGTSCLLGYEMLMSSGGLLSAVKQTVQYWLSKREAMEYKYQPAPSTSAAKQFKPHQAPL